MDSDKLKWIYSGLGILFLIGILYSLFSEKKSDNLPDLSAMKSSVDTANFSHPEMPSLPSSIEDQIKVLENQIKGKPNDWPHIRMLAGLETTLHPQKAGQLYHLLNKNKQLTADDWVEWGQLFGNSGKMDSVLFCNNEALKLDSTNPKALYNLGALAANSGKYSEAMMYWKKVDISKSDEEVKKLVSNGIAQLSKMK